MALRITLFPKRRRDEAAVSNQADCPHWELAPRWANARDIGIGHRVTHYTCANCGETVSPAEAASIRSS